MNSDLKEKRDGDSNNHAPSPLYLHSLVKRRFKKCALLRMVGIAAIPVK
jgi:hypothetical protein